MKDYIIDIAGITIRAIISIGLLYLLVGENMIANSTNQMLTLIYIAVMEIYYTKDKKNEN